jgi:Secretion system C-terminal sorting domain/PKD domain
MKKILHFTFLMCSAFLMKAQIPITNFYPLDSVYFNFNTFTASGFQPIPAVGQLSSSGFSIKPGGTQPILYFNGTQTTAATIYTRGITASAVTTAGFYAFRVDPLDTANKGFGFQQTGTFMSGAPGTANNGTITLKFRNLTTKPIYKLNVKYDMYVRNDQPRSSLIKLQGGTDTLTQTAIPAGTYKSQATAVASAPWTKDIAYNLLVNNINIPVGSDYYLSFLVSDSAGSGSRDEIAIDNFKLLAIDSIITNPSVVINAGFSANDSAVCAGTTVAFTNTTTTLPANTPLVYFWDFKDGGFDSIANPSHLFDSAGTYNVTMYAVDTISFALDSHVVSIQVFATPSANFSIANLGAGAYNFTAPSTPASNYTYAWTLNGVPVGTSQPTYANTFTASGNNTVCLKVTNPLGGCVDSICKPFSVVISPVNNLGVNIAISDSAICQGDSIALTTLSVTGGTAPFTYAWFFNGNPIPAPSLGVYNQVNNTGLGNLVLVVTDSNNFTKSDTAMLLVKPLPNANFTATVSAGNASQYILSLNMVSALVNYSLFINGTPTALIGPMPYLISFPSSGAYSVCFKALNLATNCSDSVCQTLNVTVGLNKITKQSDIKVYPNPAKDFLSIDNVKEKVNLQIFNTIGQLVKEETLTANAKLNIKELETGVYFVSLKSNTTAKTIRLVIQ